MRTGVIEVGGTTTQAVVAEPIAGDWYAVHGERRIILGVQRAIARDGHIGAGLLLLVTETVRRLREECFRYGAERTVTVVDSAVAGAEDLADLVAACSRAVDGDVRVRTPLDEARMVLRAIATRDDDGVPATVVELGEHASRIIRRDHQGIQVAAAPGLFEPLRPDGEIGAARFAYTAALADLLPPSVHRTPPVVTGAVAQAVARTVLQHRYGPAVPPADKLLLGRSELAVLERELLGATPTQRLLLPAIDPQDADVVTLGTAYLHALAGRTDAGELRISRGSVMRGQLLEALDLRPGAESERRAGVAGYCRTDHARTTAELAGRLGHALAPVYGWAPADVALLRDAAALHDLAVGRTTGGAHREGAAELLREGVPGCTPREVIELASLVRFHRGRAPGQHFAPYGRLPVARRRTIKQLTGVLRLACALDRDGDHAVRAIHVDVDPEFVCVHAFGDRPLDLVLYAVGSQQQAISRVLDRRVVVRDAGPLTRTSQQAVHG